MQLFDAEAYQDEQTGRGWSKRIVSFSYEAVSGPNGDPVNVEYIRIFSDRLNEVYRPVSQEDRINYKERYEAFKNSEDVPPDGTPIKNWAVATPADISACKNARISTIEQLAEASDEELQRSHLVGLKYKAIDFIRNNEDSTTLAKLRDDLEKAQQKIKTLEEQKQGLAKQNQALQAHRTLNADITDSS